MAQAYAAMGCHAAQRKRLPSHASPVVSKLRPQDSKMVHLAQMASIFEEPGFVTPDVPQHQFGAQREYSAQEWQTQLTACGMDPTYIALGIRDTFCTVVASRAQQRCCQGQQGRQA